MKSTIAITKEKRMTVAPRKGEPGIVIDMGPHTEVISLDIQQAGVLLWAIEQAAFAAEQAQERKQATELADVPY